MEGVSVPGRTLQGSDPICGVAGDRSTGAHQPRVLLWLRGREYADHLLIYEPGQSSGPQENTDHPCDTHGVPSTPKDGRARLCERGLHLGVSARWARDEAVSGEGGNALFDTPFGFKAALAVLSSL